MGKKGNPPRKKKGKSKKINTEINAINSSNNNKNKIINNNSKNSSNKIIGNISAINIFRPNANNLAVYKNINLGNGISLMKYNDYEINNLQYKDSLKFDKRTFYQCYISLLKYKHLLIFTFYLSNDYNSKTIKISLFLFLLSSYYAVNALFFNNDSIHNIYENKGAYDFIYQIPKILYLSIICTLIRIIVTFFSITEKRIVEVKKSNDDKSIKIAKLFKCLIIKFISFYIISFLLLIIFWYYLAIFCIIYKNSQIHLSKDTLTSFSLSLLYPFAFTLLPVIIRQLSLKEKNKDKECLYKFSTFL